MIELYQIERSANLVICGILPLCVLITSLVLVVKNGTKYSLDEDCLEKESKTFVLQILFVVILWVAAYFLLNRYYYSTIIIFFQNIVNVTNPHILRWVINCAMDLLAMVLGCKLFFQICIYPELAFRIFESHPRKKKKRNHRKTTTKRFYQFETQFWNAGIYSLHNINITLTKWVRNNNGNIEPQKVAMHEPVGEAYLENVFHKQDDRAYNWASCEDKWEIDNNKLGFEYLELTIVSNIKLLIPNKAVEITQRKRFYPFDIHQGDFKDINNVKEIPQPLVTSFNNQPYVSAKRIVQKWREGIRYMQCCLILLQFLSLIAVLCSTSTSSIDLFYLCGRIFMSLFLVLLAWRIILNIPIKANITPSYIYGSQQLNNLQL